MVALRTPDRLDPPQPDGMPTSSVGRHTWLEAEKWAAYVQAAVSSPGIPASLAPICLDLDSGTGVACDEETSQIRWGTALVALQTTTPYETYVFHSRTQAEADVL